LKFHKKQTENKFSLKKRLLILISLELAVNNLNKGAANETTFYFDLALCGAFCKHAARDQK